MSEITKNEDELEMLHRILYKLRSTNEGECVCFVGKEARMLASYIQYLEKGSIKA